MSGSTPADPNSKLMLAWEAFKKSEEYANSKRWAECVSTGIDHLDNTSEPRKITIAVAHPHTEGSLWALFMHGYMSACEDAAQFFMTDAGGSDGPGSWAETAEHIRKLHRHVEPGRPATAPAEQEKQP